MDAAVVPVPPQAAVPGRAELVRAGDMAKAAEAFEAVLLGEVARLMFEAVPAGGPFGGGHGETIYRGIMAEHMGTAMAARGGLGLSGAVLGELVRSQMR